MKLSTLNENHLRDMMQLLDGWEERYAYLIELGRQLPEMPSALKTEGALVKGCTSQVWLVPQAAEEGVLRFWADSDAHIVKGLIAILYIVYNNQPGNKLKQFIIEDYFAELGLDSHLSPNRRNGFFAMVERLKAIAQSHKEN
jgi:cysteine desulfuration protein SufE